MFDTIVRKLVAFTLFIGLIGCAQTPPPPIAYHRLNMVPYLDVPAQMTNNGASITTIQRSCNTPFLKDVRFQCILIDQRVGGTVSANLHFTFPLQFQFYQPTGAVIMTYRASSAQPGFVAVQIPPQVMVVWTDNIVPAQISLNPGEVFTVSFVTMDQGRSWTAKTYRGYDYKNYSR